MSASGHERDTHHHHLTEALHDLKVKAVHKKYAMTLSILNCGANAIA